MTRIHQALVSTLGMAVLLLSLCAGATPSERIKTAEQALIEGRFDKAQNLYELSAQNLKMVQQAYRGLIHLALLRGHIDQALTLSQKHLGSSAQELWLTGEVYAAKAQRSSMVKALGYAKKCIAAYEQALVQEPTHIKALVSAITYHQQAPGFAGGDKRKAKAYLTKLKALSPQYVDRFTLESYLQANAFKEAKALAAKMVKQGIEHVPNQYFVATAYRDMGMLGEAKTLFEDLTQKESTLDNHWFINDSFLQLGEAHLSEGKDIQAAIQWIQAYKARNTNPQDVHYYWSSWSLAKAYHAAGDSLSFRQTVAEIQSQNYKTNKEFKKRFESELKKLSKR